MGSRRTARLISGVGLALTGVLGLTACPAPAEVEQPVASAQAAQAHGPPWPALPGSVAELAAVLERFQRRVVHGGVPRVVQKTDELAALVESSLEQGTGVVGWTGIEGWLRGRLEAASRAGRRLFVLWGVHHDSAEQLAAFHRLALDSTQLHFDLVVVEQFNADGRWAGVPQDLQRGDDQDLASALGRLGPVHQQALQRLDQTQRRDNFTARHYGYLKEVLGLVATARRRRRRLCGCDMNLSLQQRASNRLSGLGSTRRAEGLLRLRELHCWLALERPLGGTLRPRHIAILWGQSHLAPKAFARFIPPPDEVLAIYLLGRRLGPHGPEKALPKRLRSPTPMLLSLDRDDAQALLLLPE